MPIKDNQYIELNKVKMEERSVSVYQFREGINIRQQQPNLNNLQPTR
jgi:hypothetical protein